jgi:outer membrane receptor protein involved in Fe transport
MSADFLADEGFEMISQVNRRNYTNDGVQCLLTAVLMPLLACSAAFAQSATPAGSNADVALAAPTATPDLTSLSMEELLGLKVYSASRHLENSQEAPAAVTVLTAQEISAYGWRTLGDALNSARGFYTSYDRNYAYLGVRGFRKSDDYVSRLLLMIDGHRVNENIYGSGFIGLEFPLDLDLIDRIEIVRGPSSSMYGTNAFFGVVNVITRKPKGAALETSSDFSSFYGRTGRITAELEKSGLSALFSGSLYRSNGPSNLYYSEFDSPETNNGIAHNIDGERFAHAFGDVRFGNFHVQGLFGSRLKIVPTASFDTNFNDPGSRTVDTRSYLDVSYHRTIASSTDLDLRAYYDSYHYHDQGAYTDPESAERYLYHIDDIVRWVGVEGTVGHQFNRRFRVIGGSKYEHTLQLSQINDGELIDGNRTPWLTAAYGEAEAKLLPMLTVRAGGRIDSYSTFGASFNPRLAVIFAPGTGTSIKYILGRAFRAPNAYEMYYSDGTTISPNPNLKPERILSHEFVLEHRFRKGITATAEGYFENVHELIELVPDGSTGLNHFANGEEHYGRGVEFEIDARRQSGWAARASYSYARAYDPADPAEQDHLSNSPQHLAKLNAMIPLPRHSRAGVELLYTAAQESDSGANVPASVLTNLTFSSRPFRGGAEFSASCYNLFDRRWYAPGGPEHLQSMIQQDGRTFRVKVTYRFNQPKGTVD